MMMVVVVVADACVLLCSKYMDMETHARQGRRAAVCRRPSREVEVIALAPECEHLPDGPWNDSAAQEAWHGQSARRRGFAV